MTDGRQNAGRLKYYITPSEKPPSSADQSTKAESMAELRLKAELNNSVSLCPKCQGEMVTGFIPDMFFGNPQVSFWIEGAPKRTFWGGAKVPDAGRIPIGAYRCSQCGYLELYARREFSPTM